MEPNTCQVRIHTAMRSFYCALGGRRKVVDTLPLRERLLAKGAYKEATNDKLRPNSAASHLFSPHKPSTKVSKEKDTSQVGKKSSKAVMQSYFRRKSNDSSRSSVSHTKGKYMLQ